MKTDNIVMIAALLLLAPTSLLAAEPTSKDATPVVQAVLLSCNVGTIVKTFGKADWQIKACNDGSLMFLPAPKNGASHPFTYHFGELETPFIEERFRDKRARAAYLEVKAMTPKQFDALLQEVRASAKD